MPSTQGLKRVALGELRQLHVGAGEGLLGGVVGRGVVAQQVLQEALHQHHVPLEQRLEGRRLSRLRALHQRRVGRLGRDGRAEHAQHRP